MAPIAANWKMRFSVPRVVSPSMTTCGPTAVRGPIFTRGPMMRVGPNLDGGVELGVAVDDGGRVDGHRVSLLAPLRGASVAISSASAHQRAADLGLAAHLPDPALALDDRDLEVEAVARHHRAAKAHASSPMR